MNYSMASIDPASGVNVRAVVERDFLPLSPTKCSRIPRTECEPGAVKMFERVVTKLEKP